MDRAKKLSVSLVRLVATLTIAAAAGIAFVWPRLAEVLIYERTSVIAGQWWRLWTGHLVHFTSSHFFWDVVVFVPAGGWLEWIAPRPARWFYLLAPPAISALLFWCDPGLNRYAGLSGLATGLLVLLALVQLRRDSNEPPWFWWAVLALVAAKTVVESITDGPLFARFDSGVRAVPLAHVGGIACALATFLPWARRTTNRS